MDCYYGYSAKKLFQANVYKSLSCLYLNEFECFLDKLMISTIEGFQICQVEFCVWITIRTHIPRIEQCYEMTQEVFQLTLRSSPPLPGGCQYSVHETSPRSSHSQCKTWTIDN